MAIVAFSEIAQQMNFVAEPNITYLHNFLMVFQNAKEKKLRSLI